MIQANSDSKHNNLSFDILVAKFTLKKKKHYYLQFFTVLFPIVIDLKVPLAWSFKLTRKRARVLAHKTPLQILGIHARAASIL